MQKQMQKPKQEWEAVCSCCCQSQSHRASGRQYGDTSHSRKPGMREVEAVSVIERGVGDVGDAGDR
ncbi:hypothetical protein [Xanthomonas campestris]|uniref:hypothetical protein n=1 Tax=Xanthomonas campestris TaxID=339 RepID=UPI0023675401|nr:hypothetical protein [Xanthomonas campestris]WDI92674.1 hypothetical protein JH280_15500 [Xanthomonas campestris]